MKLRMSLLLLVFTMAITRVYSQPQKQDSASKQNFMESSLLVLANFTADPPSYYQLNYGFHLTPKDVIIIEAWTFKHHTPMGIPYGPSFVDPEESYPGSVGVYGVGATYQRFLWKNLSSAIHVTPFLQHYYDTENEKIQNGFKLFLALRFGYQFNLFKDRFFIKPTVAFNYWPVNTNVPESFAKFENKWPNYFLFDPNIIIGINF